MIQSTISVAHGKGWYNDPYKFTVSFYPDGPPAFLTDVRLSQVSLVNNTAASSTAASGSQ